MVKCLKTGNRNYWERKREREDWSTGGENNVVLWMGCYEWDFSCLHISNVEWLIYIYIKLLLKSATNSHLISRRFNQLLGEGPNHLLKAISCFKKECLNSTRTPSLFPIPPSSLLSTTAVVWDPYSGFPRYTYNPALRELTAASHFRSQQHPNSFMMQDYEEKQFSLMFSY